MDARSQVTLALRVGFVGLVCLALLAGCIDTTGSNTGAPVTDYETYVFDRGPSPDPVIAGGIAVDDEFEEQFYVTLLTNDTEADRFNRSLLPADAAAFVDEVSYDDESLIVIQAFPASSVPDYRVESITRDGPTLHVTIDDSSDGGTDDVTVETVLVRIPGDTPENVIVTTEEGETFEIGDGS